MNTEGKKIDHKRAIQILEAIEYFNKQASDWQGWLQMFSAHRLPTDKAAHRMDISLRAAKRMKSVYYNHLNNMKA
jgi:hypothetical protein